MSGEKMDDYLSIDVQLKSDLESTFAQIKQNFPDFKWRGGDSEHNGRHFDGRSANKVRIEIWLDDTPPCVCLSFDEAWIDLADREERKTEFYESTLVKLRQTFVVGKTETLISQDKGVKF